MFDGFSGFCLLCQQQNYFSSRDHMILTKGPHEYYEEHTGNIRYIRVTYDTYGYIRITYGYIRIHTSNIRVTYGYIRYIREHTIHTGTYDTYGNIRVTYDTYGYIRVTYGYIRVHTNNIRVTYGYIRIHTSNIRVTYKYIRIHTSPRLGYSYIRCAPAYT